MNSEELQQLENNIVKRVVSIVLPILELRRIPQKRDDELKREKSVDDLVCYVRYVFSDATDKEKNVSEKVIAEFKKKISTT
jgi:hypothetical protein